MVFVQRKGMVYKFRHGPFYAIQSSTVMFSFFHCLGSHHDYCLSGIVCAFIVAFFFSSISIKMKGYAIFIFSDCSD